MLLAFTDIIFRVRVIKKMGKPQANVADILSNDYKLKNNNVLGRIEYDMNENWLKPFMSFLLYLL